MSASTLPERLRDYLIDPSLEAVWARVRGRLERTGMSIAGSISVHLDEAAANRLGGLLGRTLPAGTVRLRLEELDVALRNSAAAAGLIAVLTELTGPLVDRAAAREERDASWSQVWAALDAGLAAAGLAIAPWVPTFEDRVRRCGLLTRAGAATAQAAVRHAVLTLAEVADGTVLASGEQIAEPRWELAELASTTTGDAHGLDDGRLAGALVVRAVAAATGEPVPTSAAERRTLWETIGVTTDQVSGTALVWGLRPPGPGRWAAMLRERADLGLVTHLTVHELRATADNAIAATGLRVFACENPQVLQAAARAEADAPLVCFAGNPASAGLLLLSRLLAAGAAVAYHGDFDWPGIRITGRLLLRGAAPWRMGADDYTAAVRDLAVDARLEMSGSPAETPWDEDLAAAMRRHGVAVHEEAIMTTLLADLT